MKQNEVKAREVDSLQGGELFRHFLRKYRWKYSRGIVSLLIVDIIDLAAPLIIARAIDLIAGSVRIKPLAHEGGLPFTWEGLPPHSQRELAILAGIYLAGFVIMGLFRFVWRMAFVATSYETDRDIKTAFFSKLLKLSPRFFGRTSTGDLMSRATNDHEAVRMALGVGTLITLDAMFYLITVPPLLLYLNWELTLLVFIPLPLIPIVIVKMGKVIEARMRRVQEGFSSVSSVVQEAFSGIRVVKGYVREKAEEKKFENVNHEYVDANLHLAKAQVLMEPIMHYSVNVGLVLLFIAGGGQVLEGALTVGLWTAMQRYISRLSWPMVAIGWSITLRQRGKASAKRILEVVNEKPDVIDEGDRAAEPPIARGALLPDEGEIAFDENAYEPLAGSILVKDLHFSYDTNGGAEALRGVSFAIEPGETVALVGKIGSGKSTLVKLLAHLYPVGRGQIYVGGRDINDIPLKQLRESIGFVPQEPFLFSESIQGNIAMGAIEDENGGFQLPPGTPTPDWVRQAARDADLAGEVERLPGGYETLLGERGINLSGGQKQRLTLARALVRRPPVVVFDDTLSAVDARTEEAILERLLSYSEKRTAILISHRFTATQRADKILVLDQGRLVEEGKHEQLLAKDGIYAELYHRQQLEAALEAEAGAMEAQVHP